MVWVVGFLILAVLVLASGNDDVTRKQNELDERLSALEMERGGGFDDYFDEGV